MITTLLKNGFHQDPKDSDGRTPLSWAAERGHEAVVRLLVERDDVEADSKDQFGRTPLLWAVENGHEAVVRLLAERDDVETDSKDKLLRALLARLVRVYD
jgi:ankyrin repeat protein